MDANNIVFTPASLIDLLSKIDELSEFNVGITETIDGDLQLEIGDSVYHIETEAATEVSVDEYVAEEVELANKSAYESLSDDVDVEYLETIESGIIKEAAKSLLLGGMLRLSAKLLK